MRPRRLEIVGFGAFARPTVVDFDRLAAAGLFHIGGPTGAGKTTLIDAICFALYGKVPGAREPDHLATHHDSVAPEVTLEFSSGGHDWRVTRAPRRERPKVRGTGTTVEQSRATLLRRESMAWKPVATGPSEVDREVKALLGLDAVQFQQVVVLPQGEFEKVLRADATERERLLSSLFATARFGDLTTRLREEAKERASSCERDRDRLASIERQARERAADAGITGAEIDPLEVLASTAAEAEQHQARLVAEARQTKQRAADAHEEATAIVAALDRRDHARSEARALAEAQPHIDQLTATLAMHHRAAPVVERHVAAVEAAARLAKAVAEAGAASSSVEEAAAAPALGALLPPIDLAELGTSHLDAVRTRVAEARSAAAELDAECKAAKLASADLAGLDERQQHHADAIAVARDRASDVSGELESVREAADAVTRLRLEIDELRSRSDAARQVDEVLAALDGARADADALDAEAARAAQAHLDAIEARITGMAGELAASLVDGDACPVCGSADHPEPAAGGHAVSADDIASAGAAAAESRAKAAKAREHAVSLSSRVATLEAATEGVDALDAERRIDDLVRALAEATAAAELASELDAERSDLAAKIAAHQSALAAIDVERAGAEARRRVADERVDRLLRALEPLGVAEPAAASDDLDRLCRALDRRHAAMLRSEHAGDEARRASDALDDALASSGLRSVAQALAAVVADDEAHRITGELAAHQRRLEAVTATLDDPALAALPDTAPDIAATAEALNTATAHLETALRAHALAEAAATDLRRLAARHTDLAGALGPRIEEANRVQRLADLCHGTNPMRLSLERFVLAAYLEEIAEAASAHLVEMTSGRFRLRHSEAKVRSNAGTGLSLLVGDSLTGTEREVGTLSGGETFLASLALALGVAEVVQRHAGGVRIDALFVDEGFGSLDPESLDLALQVLDDLRDGGRLVGVVSHVAALREAIGVGIEVTPSPSGSTAVLTGPAA